LGVSTSTAEGQSEGLPLKPTNLCGLIQNLFQKMTCEVTKPIMQKKQFLFQKPLPLLNEELPQEPETGHFLELLGYLI